MNKIGIIVLCALIAFSSCKKKDKVKGATFNNHMDKQVTLTIYPSLASYASGTGALIRKTVKAGELLNLQENQLVAGKTYYFDWFTDDLYTSNWFNDAYPVANTQVAYTVPANGGGSFFFDAEFSGYARKVFLANNDLTSSWHAVDAYKVSPSTGYTSFWPSMSENEKFRQVTISKGFTAMYNYKNGVGSMLTDTLNFRVQRTEEAYIEFIGAQGTQGSMATGILPTGKAPDYKSSAKDTVLALLPNSEYYFMMVRD